MLHRIVIACLASALLMFTACEVEPSPPTPALKETRQPGVSAVLDRLVAEENFTGAVLVADGENVIHAEAFGMASASTRNTPDTLFHVASLTKQFTAAAVMQQVEAGTVDLHTSINRYLPAAYRAPQWESVMVHHLLTHSSGIAEYGMTRDYYELEDGFCAGGTVDGMLREAMGRDLEFEPGSRFSYTNISYTLLGLIVEEQSGESFATYVEQKIFAPLGMHTSRLHVEGHVPVEREAEGRRWSDDHGTFVPDDVARLPATVPGGGLITSLADFHAWTRVYAGRKPGVLAPATVKLMMDGHIASDGGDGPLPFYGYGIATDGRLLGHSGRIIGFRSQFFFDRQSGLLIAVFSNNSSNDPQRIAVELLSYLQTAES